MARAFVTKRGTGGYHSQRWIANTIELKLIHSRHENTWKCGELKLFFPTPSAGGLQKEKKKMHLYW